jgi:hypothetical protein
MQNTLPSTPQITVANPGLALITLTCAGHSRSYPYQCSPTSRLAVPPNFHSSGPAKMFHELRMFRNQVSYKCMVRNSELQICGRTDDGPGSLLGLSSPSISPQINQYNAVSVYTSHHANVFTPILSLPYGITTEAWKTSNRVMIPPPPTPSPTHRPDDGGSNLHCTAQHPRRQSSLYSLS